MLLHIVWKFVVNTIHDNVKSTACFAQFHHSPLNVKMATVLILLSGTIVCTSDKIAFPAKLNGAGIMSPKAVNVKSWVKILIISGELNEGRVNCSLVPLHHVSTITTENEQLVTIDWRDGRASSCWWD